ncbi:MAG: acetate--CoA ligase family protein [Longimicrobiales bacterium]
MTSDAVAHRTTHPLDAVLRPRSVAIVGASTDERKRGHQVIRALLDSGYRGQILPVHPQGGELLGLRVVRGPGETNGAPDLVLVCTPAATVPGVLDEWGTAGARGAVVLASGFGETGENGATLDRAVRGICERTGIRVVGPNTSGLLNVPIGLNLIGVRGVRPGSLALLVQSGNMLLQLLTEAEHRTNLGFTFCIGVGNKLDIQFWEYIDFLGSDEQTRAILMHIEGFRDGRRFLEHARIVAAGKPIVVLKAARSAGGRAAAHSHTGAIAGSYETLRAGLHQAGVLEVGRSDELLHVGETLAMQPPVRGQRGIVLLSDGGGHATLAVDVLHDRGYDLAHLSNETCERLRSLLGPAANVTNPIDLAGAADRDPLVFARALDVLAADPAAGGVLVVGLFGGYAIRFAPSLLDAEIEAADALATIAKAHGLALVVHSLYASLRSEPLQRLTSRGVPVVESLDVACTSIAAARHRGLLRDRLDMVPNAWLPGFAASSARSAADPSKRRRAAAVIVACATGEGRSNLLEPEARDILSAYGAPMVQAQFCLDANEAAHAAATIAGAVAVRVVSPSTPHKTEADGVRLGVVGRAAAAAAHDIVVERVRSHIRRNGLADDIRGVMVSPMMEKPIAELIVGVIRDPIFGPVLTVGAGGTAVEVMRDVSLRVLPIAPSVVVEMLNELRVAPVLRGLRGRDGVDFDSIIDAALAVSQAILENDTITEIEINPLFAYADHAVALDARAYVAMRPGSVSGEESWGLPPRS